MINQTVKLFLVAVLMLMPCHAFALPGAHDPLSGGQGYTCNSCHVSPKTTGNRDATYDSNICLTCHTSGNVRTKKHFAADDFANPFKTTAVPQSSTPLATSHKWFGTDTVPAAGALPPVDTRSTGLNKTGFSLYLSCARCHSVHGTSGEDSVKAPYLRMANNQDQMCLNCHRSRDTKDHNLGTHPVNVSYTSATVKAKVAAGEFLALPITNGVNPTGQVKLVNSKVVCSTCHGVHNTDSRSSTFDPFSSTHTFGQLSSSSGYLLRVDARGKTANATNICTNCHTNKFAHNDNNQNIQCNDCHGAHVEYDASAPAELKNVYLVRRFNTYSAPTGGFNNKRVLFRYTSASKREYYNYPAKTGVCQGCHGVSITHFNSNTESLGLLPARLICANCHKHNDPASSFKASGCDGCHGFPPVSLATTATGTPAYTGNETTAPHSSHASGGAGNYSFSCSQCHNGYDTNHKNNIYNDGVFVTNVAVSPGGIIAGAAPVYNGTTCTVVYCHSDGTSTTALGSPKTLTWAGGINLNPTCASCHAASPVTNSHTKHTASPLLYTCKTCHAGTVTDNTTVNIAGGKHVNAVKDVQFSQVLPAVGTTCSTVYCHSNGKGAAPVTVPVWGTASTGACGTCHYTGTSAPALATGSHTVHFSLIAGNDPLVECAKCHTYTGETAATHVNGILSAEITAGCATNTCHANIAATTWGPDYSTKDTCTKCHGTLSNTGVITAAANNRYLVAPSLPAGTDNGNVSANAKTGAHQTHLRFLNGFSNYSTVDYRCEACHDTLPTAGTHASGSSTPAFGKLATKWGAITTATFSGGSCSSVYCHNPAGTTLAAANVGNAPAPSWTNDSLIADGGKSLANCQLCHKVPGSGSFSKQTAHGVMITDASANQCNGCHGHNGDAGGAKGKRHIDGILYASGSCDTCHGYPPMKQTDLDARAGGYVNARLATAGGGGYHKTHLLPNIVIANGFTPCLPCHPSDSLGFHMQGGATVATANVNVFYAADTGYRFDSTRAKRYNPARTCSNVSCHFKESLVWY